MNPKFDGVKVYRCGRCSLIFGIGQNVDEARCPKCTRSAELIGEGMMMFFLQHIEKPSNEVGVNLNKNNYPPFLKADHIAEIISVSKRMAYEIMERKDFPLIRMGRVKRVNKDDFFTWFESHKT